MSGDGNSTSASPAGDAAIRDGAALGALEPRVAIGVAGPDRRTWLQGLLTNDIEVLRPGTGCYAAWLTPQGRLLTDMHVFESGDMILLDVPATQADATLERLDQFLFSEDVQLAGLSGSLASVWVHGPKAAARVQGVLGDAGSLEGWDEYQNARASFKGAPAVVARVSQLDMPGFVIYVEPSRVVALEAGLEAGGAVRVEPSALEAARIEAGYPLVGVDMDKHTIPLEAGIGPRAISFTKGCYVGQEVIIRVMHRGQGRVAKRLVRLQVPGGVPEPGATVVDGNREIGVVTSAARSSRLGPVALAYLHRDFVESGTKMTIRSAAAPLHAMVTGLAGPPAAGG